MQIVIFDDKRSLLHFLAGVLATLWPQLLLVYLVYEVIEYEFSNCETKANFIGDLAEFAFGYLTAGAGAQLLKGAKGLLVFLL